MEKKLIFQKMADCINDIKAIRKNQRHQQGWNFRGIDQILNAMHPIFAKNEIFVTSDIIQAQRIQPDGQKYIDSVIDYKFTFHAVDGSNVSTVVRGESRDFSDKGANQALSNAYKYAMLTAFSIPVDDIKDSDQVPEIKTEAIKKPISEDKFNKAKVAIVNGKEGILEAAKKHFLLTDEQEKELKETKVKVTQKAK